MEPLKFIHIADVHLGKRFPALSEAAEKIRRADLENAFRQAMNAARQPDVRLVLIAGDLFDRVHPSPDCAAFALQLFQETHEKNPELKIILCPGEADSAQTGEGVDTPLKSLACLPFVQLLGLGASVDSHSVPGTGLTVASVHYEAIRSGRVRPSDIPKCQGKFGVFMLHCFRGEGPDEALDQDALIENVLNPICGRGYRYLALGHHHRFEFMELADGYACFPGSLERLAVDVDREKKYYVLVSLTKDFGRASVRPRTVRTRPVECLTVRCEPGRAEIAKRLDELILSDGPGRMLHVTLEGQMNLEEFYSFQNGGYMDGLADRFDIVCLDNRLSLVDSNQPVDLRQLAVRSPEEEFKQYIQQEMLQSGPAEKELLKELLGMGLAEIQEER